MKKARKWIVNIILIVYTVFGYIELFRIFGFTDLSYKVIIYAAGAGFVLSGLVLLFNLEVVKRDFIRAVIMILSITISMPGWFVSSVRIDESRFGYLILIMILLALTALGAYKIHKHRHEIRELLMPAETKTINESNSEVECLLDEIILIDRIKDLESDPNIAVSWEDVRRPHETEEEPK